MPNLKLSDLMRHFKNSLFFIALILLSLQTFAGTTPPVTAFEKEPDTPDGNNDWYRQPVKVTLSATDLESGVDKIFYKIDGGNWVEKDFSNSLNLAPNPSFEVSSATPPLDTQDWKISNSNPGATYARDTLVYMPSFASTSIKINSTEDTWHSIDHYDMFAAATSFNSMSAYVWIKTLNITGNAYFNIYSISQDSLGQITTNFIEASPAITGTNDWTKLSTNFTPTAENVIGVYIEIGFSGTGSIWIDAANISKSNIPVTSFYVSTDGNHAVEYYGIDKAGNTEPTKSINFKIDQTPPGNWRGSGAVRGIFGNDHELYAWINVSDNTSGISTFTDKFQYSTRKNPGFGRFSSLLNCNSTWSSTNWVILVSPPFFPGSKNAYLVTPKVDFCDSNWKDCTKSIRFRAEDMAGNIAIKDVCVNGPWIKVRGKGIVRANQNIDMVSEAPSGEVNTDGLIEVGGNNIDFFSSQEDLYTTNINPPPEYDYQKYFDTSKGTKTQISTTGNLIASSGIYYISGDYEIKSQKIPSNYNSATFNQVVFVNGNLKISNDIKIANSSTALFIVSGSNVDIDEKVENVNVGIFSDGAINTAYNLEEGKECKKLNLRGIFVADKINFQRTLQGTQNEKYSSEDIVYEPKYILKTADYISENAVKWLYSD